jgi:hypothetical protein
MLLFPLTGNEEERSLTGAVGNDQRIKDTIFRTEDLVGILGHVELDGRVLLVEEMRRQP